MYIRDVDLDESMIEIIDNHKRVDIDARITYKALRQFENIYGGHLYDNDFVEQSVKMLSKGLLLDRHVAALWDSKDNDFFEKHVVSRHILGQTLDDIVWIYGIDKKVIEHIINDAINDIDKMEQASHLLGPKGNIGSCCSVGSEIKQD